MEKKIKVEELDLVKEDIPKLQEMIDDLKEHSALCTPIRSVYDGCWQEWELAENWEGKKSFGDYPYIQEDYQSCKNCTKIFSIYDEGSTDMPEYCDDCWLKLKDIKNGKS